MKATPDWIRSIKNPKLKGKRRIPVYAPSITNAEKERVIEALDATWISSKGPFISKFEEGFAKFCGSPYAAATSSGTASLTLALKAVGVRRGDEVIVPSFTMASSAFAVSYLGAKPIFVDVDLDTYLIRPDYIEQAITKRTKAIMPVYMYGNIPDMDSILRLARKHALFVISDAAEAFGSQYNGRYAGNIGCDAACFSLYVNKLITTGEGGMVVTDNKRIYSTIKSINNYSFSPSRHFWHKTIGYNFRMSNLEAAIGVAQLSHVAALLERKRAIAKRYIDALKAHAAVCTPQRIPTDVISNYWFPAFRLTHPSKTSQQLREYLADRGIETRSGFIPLHLQPCYRNKRFVPDTLPNSEQIARESILLPSGATLSDEAIDTVIEHIRAFLR